MTFFVSTTVVIGMMAILLSVLFGIPHRDLDWETTILPLARQYSNSNSSYGNDNNDTYPLVGTTIVITGATSGIGYALTNAFLKLGGTVIALGRSSSKLQRLQDHYTNEKINTTSGAQLRTYVVEMSDLSSVSKVGHQITAQFDTIDILVNNAGMHALGDMFGTKLGFIVGSQPPYYDRVFVVNYLSHFLLTELLLPSLQQKSKQRQPTIVQTSSSYHWGVDGTDLISSNVKDGTNDATTTAITPIAARPGGSVGFYIFRTQRSYANSKLAQIYHARALQQKLLTSSSSTRNKSTTIIPRIVSFCPGWVATNIGGPDDSIGTKILATIAFPAHGWGIASAMQAILTTPTPTSNINENDYYINSKTFLLARYIFTKPTPPWFTKYGFRDIIANMFSNFALLTQRLVAYAGPTKSSPESYNTTIAMSLYNWSYNAVQEYL